jgi:flagellar protein FlaJ
MERLFGSTGIAPGKYARFVLASIAVFGLAVPFALAEVVRIEGVQLLSSSALSMIIMFTVMAFPVMKGRWVRANAQDRIPLFITQMAVLSTSDMPPADLFGTMARLKGFGVLSKDSGMIERMVRYYNVPTAEACRIVASNAISPSEAEFLKGFAHSMDVGQRTSEYLATEQKAMMERFTIRSEASLSEVGFIKELFVAISTALIFMMVFVILIPILSNSEMGAMIVMGLAMFIVIDLILLLVLQAKVPRDRIWAHETGGKLRWTGARRTALYYLGPSIIASILLMWMTYSYLGLEIQFSLAVSCIPLILPGWLVSHEERKILARDEAFGPFIRALGRSQQSSEQTLPQSMGQLTSQNYDELSPAVENFSRRVNYDNDAEEAWRLFSEEAGSDLVQQFTGIYHEGVRNGADPGQTSTFIDDNHTRILGLRRKKRIIRSSFLGVAYGILISLAVTLWVTVGIVGVMGDMLGPTDEITQDYGGLMIRYLQDNAAYIPMITVACTVMILVHSIVSSSMLALLKGGNIVGGMMHFAALMFLGMISWYPVNAILELLLG